MEVIVKSPASPRWSNAKFLAAQWALRSSQFSPMMLKAEPWVEPAKGAGKKSPLRCLLCAAPTARSGAMSWICPRCQQPVFFGEARAEELRRGR